MNKAGTWYLVASLADTGESRVLRVFRAGRITSEALRHRDGPLAGACGRAGSFLCGWCGEPPGPPFAPQQ